MPSQVISRLQDVPDLATLTPVVDSVLHVSAYSGGIATWSYIAATDDNTFSTLMSRNAFGVSSLTELIHGYETVAALQVALDALPIVDGLVRGLAQSVGGTKVLTSGVVASSDPIYLSSGQTLRGQGVGATVFDYTGTGFAIRIITQGGHGYITEVSIEDMTIRSAANGIGINQPTYTGSPNATGEVNAIHCRRLVLDCEGIPLDFSHSEIVYYVDVESVLITGWKDQILKLGGGGGDGAWGFLIRNLRVNTDNSREVLEQDTAQAGGDFSITLSAGASAVNGAYDGLDVYIVAGTGAGQRREIEGYNGTSKVADVVHDWTVEPDNTSIYRLMRITLLPGIEIIDSHGSIRDSSMDIRNRDAPCIKFTNSQVHWTGGHFEPQNDQQVSGRHAIELVNESVVTHDFPQYLLPNNTWRVEDNSILILQNIQPTDNAGAPLAEADWGSVFSVEAGSHVYVRGVEVSTGIASATPRVFGANGSAEPTWLSALPAMSGAGVTALNASNLASGTVGTARLGTGTANSTTFLRGDQTYATPSGGSPGGSDTQVQFNDGSAFGGDAGLTYNKTTDTLTVANLIAGGVGIDTSEKSLYRNGNSLSVNWGDSYLLDPDEVKAIDWESRKLYGPDGNEVAQWINGEVVVKAIQSIQGASSTDGVLRIYDATNTDYHTITGADGELLFAGASIYSFAGEVAATSLSGGGSGITALNATQLTSGTVPDARFPATLPAASGVNLTALNAANVASGQLNTLRLPNDIDVTGSLNAAYNASPDSDGFIVTTAGALTSRVVSGASYLGRIETNTTGIGFFGVTPVARPGSTAEMKGALAGLGLLTDGGATDLNLDGGIFTGVGTGLTGVPDGALSANVPLKNAANTFTGGDQTVTTGNVRLDNDKSVQAKDTGGTYRRMFFYDSANNYGARNEGTSTSSASYGNSNSSNLGSAVINVRGGAFLTLDISGNATFSYPYSGDNSVGMSFRMAGNSSSTAGRRIGTIVSSWATSTDASRKGRVVFNASDATTDRECFRIESNGSVGMMGFFAATAVIQPASANQAAVAATAATNVTPYGYSQAQADAIVTLVNQLRADLVSLGLIKGSA